MPASTRGASVARYRRFFYDQTTETFMARMRRRTRQIRRARLKPRGAAGRFRLHVFVCTLFLDSLHRHRARCEGAASIEKTNCNQGSFRHSPHLARPPASARVRDSCARCRRIRPRRNEKNSPSPMPLGEPDRRRPVNARASRGRRSRLAALTGHPRGPAHSSKGSWLRVSEIADCLTPAIAMPKPRRSVAQISAIHSARDR